MVEEVYPDQFVRNCKTKLNYCAENQGLTRTCNIAHFTVFRDREYPCIVLEELNRDTHELDYVTEFFFFNAELCEEVYNAITAPTRKVDATHLVSYQSFGWDAQHGEYHNPSLVRLIIVHDYDIDSAENSTSIYFYRGWSEADASFVQAYIIKDFADESEDMHTSERYAKIIQEDNEKEERRKKQYNDFLTITLQESGVAEYKDLALEKAKARIRQADEERRKSMIQHAKEIREKRQSQVGPSIVDKIEKATQAILAEKKKEDSTKELSEADWTKISEAINEQQSNEED